MKYEQMKDEYLESNKRQYAQIKDSCEKMNMSYDCYLILIDKQGETLEEHKERMSELEKMLFNECDND